MAIVKKWIANGMRLSLEKHDELPAQKLDKIFAEGTFSLEVL